MLDAGQGLFSPAFASLQAELAAYATVMSYDQPGYGLEDPSPTPGRLFARVTS